jgi:hypothetical protein
VNVVIPKPLQALCVYEWSYSKWEKESYVVGRATQRYSGDINESERPREFFQIWEVSYIAEAPVVGLDGILKKIKQKQHCNEE